MFSILVQLAADEFRSGRYFIIPSTLTSCEFDKENYDASYFCEERSFEILRERIDRRSLVALRVFNRSQQIFVVTFQFLPAREEN